MKIILFVIVAAFLSSSAWASCKGDVGGTFKTQQPELVPLDSVFCFNCREINHHPQDIRNFMFNWAALGPYGTSPGAESIGRYVLEYRLDQPVTSHNPQTGERSDTMNIPVCNEHGQCATASLRLVHNVSSIRWAMGWYLSFNTSIREVRIKVHLPNGEIGSEGTYSATQMNAFRQQGYKLPIPTNTTPDIANDGECLNNLGQQRPPDSEMYPVSIYGGDGGGEEFPGQHWWEEEEAYGGRFPTHRCGTTSVAGESGSITVCGWFWF